MPLTLPDELLQSTKLTEAELKAELALALFQRERLTLGQAALLAGLPQLDFQRPSSESTDSASLRPPRDGAGS
jgi:predicted HTH domain antitoxin